MAAGAWTFTDELRTKLVDGTFDLDTDTFKMALFLSTSNLGTSSTTYAGLTNEHANANGYTTGGENITYNSTRSGGTITSTAVDVVWTASGGNLGASTTGRYFPIYDDTPAAPADPLICYYDYGATFTVATGETMTVDFGASFFTLA